MTLKYLIQKEFLQMRRNSFMPKIIFVFPIMIMCVMPWVMNMEVKNIVVDVVDNDRSSLSQQLVHRIEANRYFVFNGQKGSYSESMDDIVKSRADVIVEIPKYYGRQREAGQQPQILIAANAVNGTKGSMGAAYMSSLVADLGLGEAMVKPFFLYNPHQNYKVFMIPALMGILLMMLCGFLPALNIVGEKEAGTIEQINVTPVSKWTFILAKLIPYWLIALVVLTVCFVLSWAVYGITCQGPLLLVYLVSVLMALFFSSLGLIVSNYSETMQQAMLVMWFFVVCLMLLSGLFTPVRSMPSWAYLTTYVNPMHYYIDAMRTVFVRGGTFQSIAHQVMALGAFAVFFAVWAVFSYKKNS
ncbi:MAG: ABC transporter permease [Prevotella sp.]|nr:ABC transporter permease [Prevotella sp.]